MNLKRVGWSLAVMLLSLVSAPGQTPAAEPVEVIALGDSLTAGYGIGVQNSFPALLQKMFDAEGIEVRLVNAGVSGDTTAGGLNRLAWVLSGNPKAKAAILALGANDMLRGQSPERAEANLEAIITEFKAKGIRVLLCGMLASSNLGPDYKSRFDSIYPRLAKKHGLILYPFCLRAWPRIPGSTRGTASTPTGPVLSTWQKTCTRWSSVLWSRFKHAVNPRLHSYIQLVKIID